MRHLYTMMKIIIFFVLIFESGRSIAADTKVIAISSNKSFDPDLPILKYADDDVARLATAMEQAGKVDSQDITRLIDPSLNEVKKLFHDLQKSRDNSKNKLIFYYSGHSDQRGLHFFDGLLKKDFFLDEFKKLKTKTKIIIFDSCFSGALVAKGISPSGTLQIPNLSYDEPSGSIFLTSTSSQDFSYESQLLKGSIFTFNLVAGLYGSADINKDGVVTTTELYEYTYRETRFQSFSTNNGQLQLPEMNTQLQGKGAIAMSYPSQTNGILEMSADLEGIVLISHEKGVQFLRLDKFRNIPLKVELPEGKYQITIKNNDQIGKSDFKIELKKTFLISMKNFNFTKNIRVEEGKKGDKNKDDSFSYNLLFQKRTDDHLIRKKDYNIEFSISKILSEQSFANQFHIGFGDYYFAKDKFTMRWIFIGGNIAQFANTILKPTLFGHIGSTIFNRSLNKYEGKWAWRIGGEIELYSNSTLDLTLSSSLMTLHLEDRENNKHQGSAFFTGLHFKIK